MGCRGQAEEDAPRNGLCGEAEASDEASKGISRRKWLHSL